MTFLGSKSTEPTAAEISSFSFKAKELGILAKVNITDIRFHARTLLGGLLKFVLFGLPRNIHVAIPRSGALFQTRFLTAVHKFDLSLQ